MQLKTALKQIQESPELPGLFVIAFQGYDHPSAFMGGFFSRLKALYGELMFLDLEESTLNDCKAHLDMSFLGMRRLYVLRNFSSLDAASKKAWQAYLLSYAGPHGILFFESLGAAQKSRKAAPKKSSTAWADSATQLVVDLPESVDRVLYTELFSFFYPGVVSDPAFTQSLFTQQQAVSLDDAFRMMSYQMVVGRKCNDFFTQWYSKVVMSEASLFTLSQYLLGRNPRLFLRQWKACKDDYPAEFWVAYWSDQIWQAAQFVAKAKTSGLEEARKGFYRLPFTFLNNDWRRYSPEVLVEAHNRLYDFDYASKNGGESMPLSSGFIDSFERCNILWEIAKENSSSFS